MTKQEENLLLNAEIKIQEEKLELNAEIKIHNTSPDCFPFSWASDWGKDQYGLWASFTYRNIRQCFRWIAPGRFMMGSPDLQARRINYEKIIIILYSVNVIFPKKSLKDLMMNFCTRWS